MRRYVAEAKDLKDVALQLPTGSGKTLVGLLIAEWRRRKFNEKVVYLCPTRQLVNQVVEQGNKRYGLSVTGFTGRIADYSPEDKAAYRDIQSVAVTTYNSLFNTNPFFADADVVIVDDAHAAESYFASMWSLFVSRYQAEQRPMFAALCTVLEPLLDSVNYARLQGQVKTPADVSWVDKIASPLFATIYEPFAEVLDEHCENSDLKYAWSLLKDHLHGCHLYLATGEILLRPLVVPTWTHIPFTRPKQRLFMSATLGAGGDLERLTGRRKIHRIPIPDGWDRQGVGRRFFIFPERTLEIDEVAALRHDLMSRAGRSLVLVPSDARKQELVKEIRENVGAEIYGIDMLEVSKAEFVKEESAVAIVANRYDGIDFPDDDCRLLFVESLPKAANIQERFLMSRMGANVLFNERIQTRVLQSIGRCTRSLQDYSAVVITGENLVDYVADPRRRKFFHPELQAEIDFGVTQSTKTTATDIAENFQIFIDNGKEWEEVNRSIVELRDHSSQQPFPALDELAAAAPHEIDFHTAIWSGDYDEANRAADQILGMLKAPELQGYRAIWHYLNAAALDADGAEVKARIHYAKAKNAAPNVRWLVLLAKNRQVTEVDESKSDPILMEQLEHVEAVLAGMGNSYERKYAALEKGILEGLTNKGAGFEEAQRKLGELLGFNAQKIVEEGSPDPFWISGPLCLVFEDYVDAKATTPIDITKARQAASHPAWILAKGHVPATTKILPVLLSGIDRMHVGADVHLGSVAFWAYSDFMTWAQNALIVMRKLRRKFTEPGDLVWRAEAAVAFVENTLDAKGLISQLSQQIAAKVLKRVG